MIMLTYYNLKTNKYHQTECQCIIIITTNDLYLDILVNTHTRPRTHASNFEPCSESHILLFPTLQTKLC